MIELLIIFHPDDSDKLVYVRVSMTALEWESWNKHPWFWWIHLDSMMADLQEFCRSAGLNESGTFKAAVDHVIDFGPLDDN